MRLKDGRVQVFSMIGIQKRLQVVGNIVLEGLLGRRETSSLWWLSSTSSSTTISAAAVASAGLTTALAAGLCRSFVLSNVAIAIAVDTGILHLARNFCYFAITSRHLLPTKSCCSAVLCCFAALEQTTDYYETLRCYYSTISPTTLASGWPIKVLFVWY